MNGADPIAVAERLFALLDEGSFSATYKYAVLMALLDLCFEKTSRTGAPPTSLTTRELAEKVLELYWPQCERYEDDKYLRQGGVNASQQAELLSKIIEFRERHGSAARGLVRDRRPASSQLIDFIEWKLIEMPLPRLQVIGRTEHRFLYEYGWDKDLKHSTVKRYQRGERVGFDNHLLLKPGIAEALIRLNTLVRPLIRREWLRQVQLFNRSRIPGSALENFLFDREREALGKVDGALRELQGSRCFYCDERLSRGQVDHFIPWARYPNNAIENLVLAHDGCNNNKRDFLAASPHVQRWAERLAKRADELIEVAAEHSLETAPTRSRSVAVALYERLPESALVWDRVGTFRAWADERSGVIRALAAA
ncbi:MAG: HNH endonuclease [Myxococcus sp.]|nr:HNH endonuclease [Myxococcus sp.]